MSLLVFGQLGDLLRGPNAAVFAGVKTEHIGCLVPDHLEGVERREDAFVGHDEDDVRLFRGVQGLRNGGRGGGLPGIDGVASTLS